MCGIAGIVATQPSESHQTSIQGMLRIQRHRGPDDEGIKLLDSGRVVLGHRRLSIIDLSPAGHQPMGDESGTLWIIFNGEIFNYIELAEELKQKGHHFRSRSDTEVILNAYREFGFDCVSKFNGMWAFAIWDDTKKILFCARDRFGVKPFYFHHNSSTQEFLFASEIKALLAARPSIRKADLSALRHFLSASQFEINSSTLFSQIRQLPPAHYLVVKDGQITSRRYWQLEESDLGRPMDMERAAAQLYDLLYDSVRLRLRSDVPVGTCLSGGLDSSSIAAIASAISGTHLKVFSAVYDDAGLREGHFARRVAERFGLQQFCVTPEPKDFLTLVSRITWHMDIPTAGAGVISQWEVMRMAAAENVHVLLDGQGGDELLGGYPNYLYHALLSLFKTAWARPTPRQLIELTLSALAIRRYVRRSLFLKSLEVARRRVSHLPRSLIEAVMINDVALPTPPDDPFMQPALSRGEVSPLRKRLEQDLLFNSIPQLLHYEDRNSMAFSIEARTPFLDYRFVEFCMNLPAALKIRRSTTKWVLREAMRNKLPPEIVDRKDKLGYPTPINRWLRQPWARPALELLNESRTRQRGIWDADKVNDLVQRHLSGSANIGDELWRLFTCEIWFRTFIDRPVEIPEIS